MGNLSKALGEQWECYYWPAQKVKLSFEERTIPSSALQLIFSVLQSLKGEPYTLVVPKSKGFFEWSKYPTKSDLLAPVWDQVRSEVEAILREHLGDRARILGYRKSIEEEDYAIYVEVPLEIYRDLDQTSSVGGRVIELSDEMGIPFFCYFVPAQNESTPQQ